MKVHSAVREANSAGALFSFLVIVFDGCFLAVIASANGSLHVSNFVIFFSDLLLKPFFSIPIYLLRRPCSGCWLRIHFWQNSPRTICNCSLKWREVPILSFDFIPSLSSEAHAFPWIQQKVIRDCQGSVRMSRICEMANEIVFIPVVQLYCTVTAFSN